MSITPEHAKNLALSLIDEMKGEDIVAIDLAGKASFADYMIVATATSRRQAIAMANKTMDMLKSHGLVPIHAEGMEMADWVLVDAGDIVIHIFQPETRPLYKLEDLWAQKPLSRHN
ncbi:MAG: ribosome silencing factor [Proteobacteria bacterium]|nr:ribosome silencing factor [Pseudomonadota bacterium]